jgi:hypothetical protein
MKRLIGTLIITLALSLTGSGAFADPGAAEADKGKELVTCPITNQKVEKSKAIPVQTMSGKTVYVCCKGCVAAAKQLK